MLLVEEIPTTAGNIIVDSLRYCQEHKGLDIYAWVLMSNHLHAIVSAREGYKLSDILRDFNRTGVPEIYFQKNH